MQLLFIYLFLIVYLTALGLSCSMGSLLAVACGIRFQDQGLNLGPLLWEHEVLATGPQVPKKSLDVFFDVFVEEGELHVFLLHRFHPPPLA